MIAISVANLPSTITKNEDFDVSEDPVLFDSMSGLKKNKGAEGSKESIESPPSPDAHNFSEQSVEPSVSNYQAAIHEKSTQLFVSNDEPQSLFDANLSTQVIPQSTQSTTFNRQFHSSSQVISQEKHHVNKDPFLHRIYTIGLYTV